MSTDHAVTFSSPEFQAQMREAEAAILATPDPYPSLDPDLADLLAEIPWRF